MIFKLFVITTKKKSVSLFIFLFVGGTNKKATRGENHDDALMSADPAEC